MPADPTETSALFRYAVIAEALNARLGPEKEAGWYGRLPRGCTLCPTATR